MTPSGILCTDLYQLAMMQAYGHEGMAETAVFEMFVRKLPARRNFLVAAGLEQCLQYLETLAPTPDELAWLEDSKRFDAGLLEQLAGLRFTGDVDALPEGTICFPDEPLIRVVAPLPVAQLVETRLINLLHFQTVIASKAARTVLAAKGRLLVDFGYRRAHGAEAGLLAARAAYLAGFDGTATMQAGMAFGIPLYGTMAHSFIQAHASEEQAFLAFARARPQGLILLVDTYDTLAATRTVARLAPLLAAEGVTLRGVRIDSGDLGALARDVRRILDAAGLAEVTIFASGGLDEDRVGALLAQGAPIDGFGVGTSLTTAEDAPALDCAYKLQEYAGRARRKWSTGKSTWPGRKQVFRRFEDGRMAGDSLGLEGETQEGTPLLQPMMRQGRRLGPAEPLAALRARTARELAALPEALRGLEPAPAYPVRPSEALRRLAADVDRGLATSLEAQHERETAGRWEHFPHGADVGVRGVGPSPEAAFAQAALAVTAIVTDPLTVRADERVEIACRADDPEQALFAWLNAVITEMATRRLLFGAFRVARDGNTYRGIAWGERLDAARHQPAVEPKGATYTALAVRQDPAAADQARWVAECVIDV